MRQKSIIRIVIGSFLLLFSHALHAQKQRIPEQWFAEDHSGSMEIKVSDDTLDITAPKGFTLWHKEYLSGEYEISYHAKVIMKGGKYDRLSDLNCFWAANDPQYPNDLFTRSQWRKGIFKNYKTLRLFYVGYGGNHNSTTRFRQYLGGEPDTEDSLTRPVIKEYTDKQHLLFPNRWYHIRIQIKKKVTTFYVDNEMLFEFPLKDKEGNGHFGLRLLSNHILFAGFQIKRTK